VTIRERDSWQQVSVSKESLVPRVKELLDRP
jgi:glycyl-tRNA synthetase (class II)